MKTFKALAMCIIMANTANAAVLYNVTDIGDIGGFDGTFPQSFGASKLNNNNQVVGKMMNAKGNAVAFYYDGSKITTLPGAVSSDNVDGFNNSNQLIYGSWKQNYLYNTQTGVTSSLPANVASVGALNNKGQYVGTYDDLVSQSYSIFYDGTVNRKLNGRIAPFGLSDGGQITGQLQLSISNAVYGHAFYLNAYNGAPKDLGTLGGTTSAGRAVNSNGYVVGESDADVNCGANCLSHAFYYNGQKMIDLGMFGASAPSFATAINGSNVAVGYSSFNPTCWNNKAIDSYSCGQTHNHAFIYNGQYTDLNAVISPANAAIYTLQRAVAINDKGVILVNAYNFNDTDIHALLLTPVTVTSNGPISGAKIPTLGLSSTPAVTGPDVSVSLTTSGTAFVQNTNFSYGLMMTNGGLATTNAVMTFTLPSGVTYVSTTGGSACSFSAPTLTCKYATIAEGQTYVAQAIVKPTLVGAFSAKLSATSVGADSNLTNNTATVVVSVAAPPMPKLITKMSGASGNMLLGTITGISLQITNSGSGSATNVSTTFQTPASVSMLSATAGCAVDPIRTHTVTCTYASVPPNGVVLLNVQVKSVIKGSASIGAVITSKELAPIYTSQLSWQIK